MQSIFFKKLISYVLAISSLMSSFSCYALPFSVGPRPGFPLPTIVISGGIARAFYTVTNNANAIRSGNYVKYLPPHVTQVISDPTIANLCGASFTLQPRGSLNDSCVLELTVEGAVNDQDNDPHHHLFVCYSNTVTCAGTLYPLKVTEISGFIPRFVTVGNFTLTGSTPALLINSSSAKDWLYITPASSPGTFVSANLFSVSCTQNFCGTVGQYNLGSGFQPGIIVSENGGIAWQFVAPGNAPGTIINSSLNSVNCQGNTCAAAGQYNIGGGMQPAIIVSTDSAKTWNFVNPSGTPGGIINANLNTVLCPSGKCIAVGQYNSGAGFQPAIIRSNDNGQTWNYIVAANPPGVFTSTALSTVDCTGNTCAIAGQYNLGSGTQPAIIVSLNGGIYQFITPSSSPGTIRSTTLRTVRCVGNVCVAVGQYSLDNVTTQPAVIVSNDIAASWHFVSPSNSPGAITSSILTSVDCSGNTCAAVGKYDLGSGAQPAIVVSTDTGVSWQYITPTNVPGIITNSTLNSVNCTGSTCIAVGQYDLGSGMQAAILVSLDNGPSWHFITISDLPQDLISANLFSSTCNDGICIAVGQYNNTTGSLPLIVASIDNGASWQFANFANPPGTIISARLNQVAPLLTI